MRHRLTRPLAWAVVLALIALAACTARREAIVLDEGMLIVENQTSSDWQNVIVTVNDHFSGGTPKVAAGSRMTAPLGQFKTAFGQPYDRTRQSVYKVEVKATDTTGAIVHLVWNGDRKPA